MLNALDWTQRGMDFADALHFARAQECEASSASTSA
jgi:predicted nucleic acid-binding protein